MMIKKIKMKTIKTLQEINKNKINHKKKLSGKNKHLQNEVSVLFSLINY